MIDDPGYQNYNVPAPTIVIPPPGGLLATVSNFTTTFGVNQDFTGASVNILFQQEAVLPAALPSEITVVADNNFSPNVAGIYRIAWQLTVVEFGGAAACTVRSLLRLNSGAEWPGTPRTLELEAGGAGVMAGEIWINFNGTTDDYEFLISRTAGAGTPRLLNNEIAHSVARMTTPP